MFLCSVETLTAGRRSSRTKGFISGLKLLLATAAAALFLIAPTALPAQTGNGTVRGTVLDPDAAIIPGASIMLTPASGNAITAASGSDGTFRISVPAGVYTMSVSMTGFATLNKTNLRVNAGQIVTSDAKLVVGEQTEIVTVTSDDVSVSVDSDSNASSMTIKGADLDALSDDPDELSSELTALAGPSAGPSGGQIYVDGFTGGQLPPKSSIREIRINQNPFSAEFDKLGFGRVQIFTKPGTDKLRGNLSIQGVDNVLNTSNPFLGSANSQPPYHTFFVMGNVTGPLNRFSSYSIAGSRRSIQTNVIVDPTGFYSTSPTDSTPCAPGAIGCANYGFPATASAVFQPQLRWDMTPRVDIAIGQKNVLTMRYQYEQNSTQNSGSGGNALASTFSNSSSNENTIQISDTQTFNPKVVNETRFEYQRSTSNIAANSSAANVVVQGNFISGGASTQLADSANTHIEAQNYTSLALAKHFVRFGGRLRTTGETSTNVPNTNGLFTYNYLLDPCTDSSVTNKGAAGCSTTLPATAPCSLASANASSYQCGTPSQFRLTTVQQKTVTARETDVGLYAEDDWKALKNLTITAGLRYETENVISKHDMAPRLAIAYGIPRGNGKNPITVIRGGFGLFYDRFSLSDFLNTAIYKPGVQTTTSVRNPGAACAPGNIAACGTSGSGGIVTYYALSPNLRSAYTMQAAIGVDQQIGKIGTLSVNYLPSRGNHEYFTRASTNSTAQQSTDEYQSEGVFRENQLFVNANIRTKTITAFGYYALNLAKTNAGSSTFIPTSTDTRVDYGRAAFANKHFVVVGANYTGPYKIAFSPFLIAHSGNPYNITTGLDNNQDLVYNDRPSFANGASANCLDKTTFSSASTTATQIPINYCTGPAAITFNLRVARTWGFGPKLAAPARGGRGGGGGGGRGGIPRGPGGPPGGGGTSTGRRYNVTFGVQAQNLFNDVNYAAPTATSALTSTQFGKQTQLSGRPFGTPNAVRVMQLQMTFNF